MEINTLNVYLLIFGTALCTYIPRALPIVFLAGKELPEWLKDWMKFIPVGIFAALILPDILTNNKELYISIDNIKLIASIIVLVVSLKKKSLGLSILVGVITITVLNYI